MLVNCSSQIHLAPRFAAFVLVCVCVAGCAATPRPLVIAHRGASGYLPEHTLEAYAAAYFAGADAIEPDVVITADGVAICHHDLTLDRTTDVEEVFPARARADGNWYVADFTLDELSSLVVDDPDARIPGATIATLDDMLAMIAHLNERTGRRVGVVPEMKHPAFHADEGHDILAIVAASLRRSGVHPEDVIVQCFNAEALERARRSLGPRYTYMYLVRETLQDRSLQEIAEQFGAIGVPRDAMRSDNTLAGRAREAGLVVYAYTYKDDPAPYTRAQRTHRVDGVFTDYPSIAIGVFEGGRPESHAR